MSARLDLLRPILAEYKRRFTVLDIGAGIEPSQNIGQQVAAEFDTVTVSIEKDFDPISTPNPAGIVLKREVTHSDLVRWNECEHVDVVLALNILHWAKPDDWRDWARVVLGMGEHVVVQIPAESDYENNPDTPGRTFYHDLVREIEGRMHVRILGHTSQFPGHPPRPLYLIRNAALSKNLTRTHLDAHDGSSKTLLMSDYRRLIAHHKGRWQAWIPGFNLYNLLRMGMVSPSEPDVLEMLNGFPLPEKRHGDITLHNFIFDGKELTLVDGYDDWGGYDAECLRATVVKAKEMYSHKEKA